MQRNLRLAERLLEHGITPQEDSLLFKAALFYGTPSDKVKRSVSSDVREIVRDGLAIRHAVLEGAQKHEVTDKLSAAHHYALLLELLVMRDADLTKVEDPEKRKRLASIAHEVYAPVSRIIGLPPSISHDLSEHSFAILEPKLAATLASHVAKVEKATRKTRERLEKRLKEALDKHGLQAEIGYRNKTPYSIWEKMIRRKMHWREIKDIAGCRAIVWKKERQKKTATDDDLRQLNRELEASDDLHVKVDNDFLDQPKCNENYDPVTGNRVGGGVYRALHLLVNRNAINPRKNDSVELQLVSSPDYVRQEKDLPHDIYKRRFLPAEMTEKIRALHNTLYLRELKLDVMLRLIVNDKEMFVDPKGTLADLASRHFGALWQNQLQFKVDGTKRGALTPISSLKDNAKVRIGSLPKGMNPTRTRMLILASDLVEAHTKKRLVNLLSIDRRVRNNTGHRK